MISKLIWSSEGLYFRRLLVPKEESENAFLKVLQWFLFGGMFTENYHDE